MKKRYLIAILLLSLFTLTGCFTKQALTTDEVKSKVSEIGFNVSDAKSEYADYDHIIESLELGNSNFYIQFFVVNDEEKAKILFNNNKEIIDGNRNGTYKNSSTSGKNYETYELESDGKYMYVSRIDNTIIYANEKVEYKEEIRKIIDTLKY